MVPATTAPLTAPAVIPAAAAVITVLVGYGSKCVVACG